MKTINLEPSPEGYANIAEAFLNQLISDIKANRYAADLDLLEQALTIVGYLVQVERADLVKDLIEHVRSRA